MSRFKAVCCLLKTNNSNEMINQSRKLRSLSLISHFYRRPIRLCSTEVQVTDKKKESSALDSNDVDLSDYSSTIKSRFNFAMYADKSPIIQKFIDLGVNLYLIEKRPPEAKFLLTLSFEKIQPYLLFLSDVGICSDKFGDIITKYPYLFKEDINDLSVRVNYLMSKKFSKKMISTIIEKNPKFICTPVKVIDSRLGYLQQTFKLSGDNIRQMVTKTPAIALIEKKNIIINTYALKEELGLDNASLKKVIVEVPSLLKKSSYDLVLTFEFLTRVMKIPLDLILKQPEILTSRHFILRDRHKFLESLGRAQYNNNMPGYVNLKDLVVTKDSEFCEKIAKTSENLYYEFLKTL